MAREQESLNDKPVEIEAGVDELIDLVIAAHEARAGRSPVTPAGSSVTPGHPPVTPARIDGVVIGRLAGILPDGGAVVLWPGCPDDDGQTARGMTLLADEDVGRDVALLFEGGDPAKPVVMGLMFQNERRTTVRTNVEVSEDGEEETTASVDGDRLVFSAEKEIVLQCGEASITLTRAGKLILRGAYVSSRSSGVNRVQGASVLIN